VDKSVTEAQYWKFKFDLQEIAIAQSRLEARLIEVFKFNGLDPAKTYEFDDETFTLKEKE
jgi:hypothetical protein